MEAQKMEIGDVDVEIFAQIINTILANAGPMTAPTLASPN